MQRFLLFIVVASLITGCGHVISEEVRTQVDPHFTDESFFKAPGSYKGDTLILGGVIVSSRNVEKGSYIEILQKPLSSRGVPEETDISLGRFVAYSKEFLDKDIYSAGRRVTVAGVMKGTMEGKVGDMQYDYPLIQVEEIRLHRVGGDSRVHFSIGIWHAF
ncbi:MAG: Slp family lipoprotein [Thermodesulfovibrionales bacterium]